jgi:hypothetical protein
MTAAGFPHSDTPGSQLGCQLPRAYRRLQRPSSALDAKASTMCPLQLAKHKHSTKTTKTHTTKTNTHTKTPSTTQTPTQKREPVLPGNCAGDARVHYPEIKYQEANSPQTNPSGPAGSDVSEPQQCAREPTPPAAHPVPHHQQHRQAAPPAAVLEDKATHRAVIRRRLHYPNTTNATEHSPVKPGCVLLRKEVIQPHLPVRLPCYDFVPIASPTFDGSLHKGWATGFGCCRLS